MGKLMFQQIRGMRDVLPEDCRLWQNIENQVIEVLTSFGYEHIRLPILESSDLFARTIGEGTDILDKEMYQFSMHDGDMIALRPEGTAGCVRAGIERHLLYRQEQRLWYKGPMFRYERPQKGRYRQHEQIGVEVFGIAAPELDVELLQMLWEVWGTLGLQESLTLTLNSLGNRDARLRYREALVDYLMPYKASLDEDSQRRLTTNPLRILDTKSDITRNILENAPKLSAFLSPEDRAHFNRVLALLDKLAIPYVWNESLVRGLDYYTKTVFEWVTQDLGAQGTVSGGGRYDNLVEHLGGKHHTPAAGFGLGLDRLLALYETKHSNETIDALDVYFVVAEECFVAEAMQIAMRIRQSISGVRLRVHHGGGKLDKQLKKADKSDAKFALILGEDEHTSKLLTIKFLRSKQPQEQLDLEAIIQLLRKALK